MDFEIDESRMLYGLGAFLGVVAILYFGQEIILGLSPTIKSFILFSASVFFLGAAEYVRQGLLRTSLYFFSVFSYLSFLVYIFMRFSFSSEETFLILALSSIAFIALGYLKSEREYELDQDQSRKLLGVIAALVALTIVFDVMGAQPEYELELKDSVEVVEGERTYFGQLVIKNDFLLSRNVEASSYQGCLFAEDYDRGVYLSPDAPDLISGDTTSRFNLTDTIVSRTENVTVSGNYTVRREECPSEPEPGVIYIYEDDDGEFMRRSYD